jgi:flagellar biosynthetic protein FliQ
MESNMTPETIYMVSQEAMVIGVKLTAPILLSALAVGLVIAMFQAATQINEMTLTFVPKLITIALVLMLAGPWMLQMYVDYLQDLFRSIPELIG